MEAPVEEVVKERKPSLAAREIGLKRHSPQGPRGRTHSPTSSRAVAERRGKGGSHMMWPGWWQQVSHPTPETDESVSAVH